MARWISWRMAVLAALVLYQSDAFGMVASEQQSIDEQLADADIATLGTVANIQSQWADGQIITAVTLEVERFFKGTHPTPLTFSFLGGVAPDGTVMRPSGMPTVEIGDDVLVLLRLHEGRLWLANASLGYWRIIFRNGRRHVIRDLREIRLLLVPPARFSKAVFGAGGIEEVPLATLLPNNDTEPKRRGLVKTYERSRVPSGRYAWWGLDWMPLRFKLDVPAYSALGFVSGLELEVTLRRAVSRWTAVPGSYLALAYAGPAAVEPEKLDFVNVISTKSLSAINPLLLARATWWGHRQTGQIADCDIVFNRDRRELARVDVVEAAWSHELGHCAGLSHSTDQSALMYGERINDRGPELAPDDVLGLQQIYPVPRRPASEGVPEIYISPPSGPQPAGTINLQIQLLNAGGRVRLTHAYLGANGINYTWLFTQYTSYVAYATPHGWVMHFPTISFPQPGLYPLEIRVCARNDLRAEACQTAVYR